MHLTKNLFFTVQQLTNMVWIGLLCLSGCIRLEPIPTSTPLPIEPLQITPSSFISATNTPDYGWSDANFVMEGICFEAAEKRLDQVYTLRNSAELEQFYSQIDRSQLCEDPVNRAAFTFNNGDVLVGVWSDGRGCGAEHMVQNVQRDNTNRQIAIQLQLVINSDCPYELIRPFWVTIKDAEGYAIQINVVSP